MARHRKARRPRRVRRARKGGKGSGKMSNNTKVDATYTYKRVTPITYNSGAFANYMCYSFSPLNSNFANLNGVSEFNAQSAIFDEFCVTSVRVVYKPVMTMVSPQYAILSYSDPNIYSIIDRDGNVPLSFSVNVADKLQSYNSCKKKHYTKTQSRVITCKKFWMDTATPNIPAGVQAVYQPQTNAGLNQVITWYGQGLPGLQPGDYMGIFEVYYKVQFRGKKPSVWTYDQTTGSVLITPMSSMPNQIVPQNRSDPEGAIAPSELQVSADAEGHLILRDLSGNVLTGRYVPPDNRGPTGPTGIPGLTGSTGPTGETGPTGALM